MKGTARSFFVLVLLLISFNRCALLKSTAAKAKALTECKFELKKVDKKISFKENVGNFWNYVITIHVSGINPTQENISLGNYRLDLYANDKLVTDIASQDPIALIPSDTTMIKMKAVIAPSGVWIIFWKNLLNKKIEYRIRGTFYLRLGEFSYPFAIDLARWEENEN